ncbi:hypothetical protein [Pelagovum pacificum]|uniref:Uncharacterized protein n=1 Tax=Pelagovum pacificum TaxID=2588711 RepID=A0A5C5GDE0_9RHOB|nr:hypothetical protein [Pelagovum pacificum]QQA44189.1 hypothetical protein I8N54_06315 [Pelagovum pacificum]TNY32688.1 hypothetical protein FHY64_05250 [Pelagovum pacificum]
MTRAAIIFASLSLALAACDQIELPGVEPAAPPPPPEPLLVFVEGVTYSVLAVPGAGDTYSVSVGAAERETAIKAYLNYCQNKRPYIESEWAGRELDRQSSGAWVIEGPCSRPDPATPALVTAPADSDDPALAAPSDGETP